jgi:hypothetical protein
VEGIIYQGRAQVTQEGEDKTLKTEAGLNAPEVGKVVERQLHSAPVRLQCNWRFLIKCM